MSDPATKLDILIISGRSGSGKSSTAYEICYLLKRQKIPHVHIDGDSLDALYPRDDFPEMMLANLRLMWTTFWAHFNDLRKRDTCKKSFVVVLDGTAMVLHLERIAEVFTDVVRPPCQSAEFLEWVDIHVNPVLLEAKDEVVRRRLGAREIGGELEEHLDSTNRMSQVLDQVAKNDVQSFVNDSNNITDLAREILKHVGLEV